MLTLLFRLAIRGPAYYILACWCAGWLSFFGVLRGAASRPTQAPVLLFGWSLCLAALLLAGPLLASATPALQAAGAVPGEWWLTFAIGVPQVLAYRKGRRILLAAAHALPVQRSVCEPGAGRNDA